jgi:nucleotide-binding universal stress UspA family protein
MIKFNLKNVLVPYDFSKAADIALTQAAFMCAYSKADLHISHIQKKSDLLNLFLPIIKKTANKDFQDFITSKLQSVADKVKKEFGIKVNIIVKTGNIASELITISKAKKIDLIVMGTRGKDSDADLFFGSNAYRLISKSEVPVMTYTSAPKQKGISTILLPIDLTNHSRQKIDYAIDMAKNYKAKIVALGVYNEDEKEQKFKLEIFCQQIEKLCAKNKVNFVFDIEKTKHRVQKTLTLAKRYKADVIITMTDQKIESGKGLLSSYNHELINNSKIAVISIAPEISKNIEGSHAGLLY